MLLHAGFQKFHDLGRWRHFLSEGQANRLAGAGGGAGTASQAPGCIHAGKVVFNRYGLYRATLFAHAAVNAGFIVHTRNVVGVGKHIEPPVFVDGSYK